MDKFQIKINKYNKIKNDIDKEIKLLSDKKKQVLLIIKSTEQRKRKHRLKETFKIIENAKNDDSLSLSKC